MILAEASGESEARDLLPLRPYAASGSLYERTIRRLGYTRDQFVTTNVARCRPANNLLEGMPFEYQALDHCRPNLLAAISKHKPRVLVALGNVALISLTGWSGEKRSISHLRGYVLRALPDLCLAAGNPDLAVVPTYHPAFLRRGAIHLSGVIARDIQRAVNISRGADKSFILDSPELTFDTELDPWDDGYEDQTVDYAAKSAAHLSSWMARHNLNYTLHPTPTDLDAFCRDVKSQSDAWLLLSPDAQRSSPLALSSDIETVESASLDEDATDGYTDTIIEQIQFSIRPSQGISLTWDDDHQQAASWLLRLPLPKVGHNWWLFDHKVLRAVGARQSRPDRFIACGTAYDTLQMFHYWQSSLPAHLQFAASFVQFPFPWKHFSGTNLPFYGCCDTDSTLRIYQSVKKTMMDRGIWDDPDLIRATCGYINQTQRLRPILADMEDRGVPVDDARRLALDKEFDAAAAEVFLELNQSFPDEARKVEPKKGYAGIPPRVKKLLADEVPPIAVREIIFQSPPKKRKNKEDKPGEYFHFELRHFSLDGTEPPRWCRIFDFSPNSSQQIIRYMKAKRHKVPTKKGGAETSDKKELERLAAKHHDNFYFKVIEYRELTKMRGTYIDGFKPQADGCVHTTFTFDTATGQLSSRNPNCFSADTEVLTMCGWIPFPELLHIDRVAEWKMDSKGSPKVRFSYPTAYIDRPHNGTLRHIYTDEQIDILATPDHRCPLQHRKKLGMRDFSAATYPEDYRQLAAGIYEGGSLSYTEAQIVLICALQADGHVHKPRVDKQGQKRGEGGHYSIDVAKTRKVKRLRWALDKEGLRFSTRTRPSSRGRKKQHRTYISREDIPIWWRDKKVFGDWILWLDRPTLDLLEREIWFWDGCADRESMYSSSTKSNTDWAQIITILSDRRGKVRLYPGVGKRRDNWQVDAVNHNYSMTTNLCNEEVLYKGRVYCVTMPWGTVVVRRNGKVAFTGNCQNVPKHGKLADTFRAIIRHPEKLIIEWDYKSFHVLTTGFEAHCPEYMRLARLDMHSFIAWHFLKLPGADELYSLPDEELGSKLSWFKSDKKRKYVRDKQSKPAILGIGFGLGEEKFYNMNLEHFSSLAEANKLRNLIKGIFPRVFVWQDEIRETAHQQTFLKSRYGSMRWFYEVKVPDGRGGWRSGEQGEEAIAFLPATDAFGHIRAAMLELRRRGLDKKWGMFNTVHDSVLTLVHPSDLDEHIADFYPILTAPSKVLIDPVLAPHGLAVDVEASAGVSWAKSDLKELSLPRLTLA